MKVKNMTGSKGNKVANQFIIEGCTIHFDGWDDYTEGDMFQSYKSNIVFKSPESGIFLDKNYWDYSVTTSKYRNQFLGETKKETQAKINDGTYILCNLN